MKNLRFLTILILSSTTVFADELVLNLNGFEIGQYREVAKGELGSIFKEGKYEDGFEYQIFLLKPDTSLYMIFEYSPIDIEIIWSIQITGKNFKTDFKNLTLGMDKSKVLTILGEPSRKKDVGEYGEKWEYDKTNYSVEINKNGLLSSIKLTDESYEWFSKQDLKKLPKFGDVIKALTSKKNFEIEELLDPAMEVYYSDSTYFFDYKMSDDLESDKSGMFKLIRELSKTLNKVDTKNIDEYEENMRLTRDNDTMHVVKIKKGQKIHEIVFKWRFGKYLVWEIKA